ncbi:MAG: hypothetical protein AB7I24_08295 [Candidatus Nanopelagicales bacterium]
MAAAACADDRAFASSLPPSTAAGYQCCPDRAAIRVNDVAAVSPRRRATAHLSRKTGGIPMAMPADIPIDDFAVPMMFIVENGKLVAHSLNDEGNLVCERPSGCTHGCAPHQQRYNAAS